MKEPNDYDEEQLLVAQGYRYINPEDPESAMVHNAFWDEMRDPESWMDEGDITDEY